MSWLILYRCAVVATGACLSVIAVGELVNSARTGQTYSLLRWVGRTGLLYYPIAGSLYAIAHHRPGIWWITYSILPSFLCLLAGYLLTPRNRGHDQSEMRQPQRVPTAAHR